MMILAGLIILTLSDNGIIEQAQNSVKQTDLNQIKMLAQLKWADAYAEGKRKQVDLEQAVFDGLDEAKITPSDYNGYIISVTENGVDFLSEDEILNHKGIIPEGGVYYVGVDVEDEYMLQNEYETYTEKLIAGDKFPETSKQGDIYVYGDYEYRYDASYMGLTESGAWHATATPKR